jgi:hypothetical protein
VGDKINVSDARISDDESNYQQNYINSHQITKSLVPRVTTCGTVPYGTVVRMDLNMFKKANSAP